MKFNVDRPQWVLYHHVVAMLQATLVSTESGQTHDSE
jgi:hypothetical protein